MSLARNLLNLKWLAAEMLTGVRRNIVDREPYRFLIEERLDGRAPSGVLESALHAAYLTMDRHSTGTEGKTIKITLCEYIDNPHWYKGDFKSHGLYDHRIVRITICLRSILLLDPVWAANEKVALIAAHEAMHLVQCFRGDTMVPSFKALDNGNYEDDQHEIEAWDEALITSKEMFPSSPCDFVLRSLRWFHAVRVGMTTPAPI